VKYIPITILLIGMVVIMAGMGDKGLRAGGSIVAVILAFVVLAILFGIVVARTL
jgi:hypothetical protein